MSIAKIIAPVTGAKRDAVVLQTAFVAAKPYNAHVEALHIHTDPRFELAYTGVPLSPDIIQAVIDASELANRATAKAVRSILAETAKAAGVEIVATPRKSNAVTCSFQERAGSFSHCVAKAGQLSDLIVFGPLAPADGPDLADAFVETLTRTDRPVLLGPQAPKSLNGTVMIAWDGSVVAERAVVGALPFLHQAGKVVLLSCRHRQAHKPAFREVEQYLALHGISCSEEVVDPDSRSIGEALVGSAIKGGADLLVMGGYGHSHLGETFFGGVTQYVRWHAALPVLMIH